MELTPAMTWFALAGVTAAVGLALWVLIGASDRLADRLERLPLAVRRHPTFVDAERTDLLDDWSEEASA